MSPFSRKKQGRRHLENKAPLLTTKVSVLLNLGYSMFMRHVKVCHAGTHSNFILFR